MWSIIGTVCIGIIMIMAILLVCGAPLGEFTMGGQQKVLPKKLRLMTLGSLVIQAFSIVILLQSGGLIPLWFPHDVTRVICFVFAVYLSLNSLMNLFSRSNKERFMMTPIAVITAVCFWITAFSM